MKSVFFVYNSNYLLGNLCCLTLAALVIVGILLPLANDDTAFGLKLLKTYLTQDQNEFHHIVGLAQNDLNMTLDYIFVQVNILDKDNTILGNYSSQVDVHPLNPSEVTPFDVIIYDKVHNSLIKNYTIDSAYDKVKTNIRDLEIHSTNSKLDVTGFYYISGRITNNMNITSDSTTIIAALDDKNGDLIGIWKAQSEPYNIPPFSAASFTIPVTDRSLGSNINNNTLYYNNS